MNAIASVFDHEGRFVQTISGSWEFGVKPTLLKLALPYVMGELDDRYWLYGGEARLRRPCPVILDDYSLLGVRPGSIIIVNGQPYNCPEGGDVELGFDQPGRYKVTVVRWPYLEGEFEIENLPS